MIGLGSADAPAFDTREIPLELAAAGYEANGADTDVMTEWLSPGSRYHFDSPEVAPLRDYRTAAEAVFDTECEDRQNMEREWTAHNDGTARWSAEVIYEPEPGETDSGVWFSRARDEPDPDDVHASGYVLPGLDVDAILEVNIRMAPGHPGRMAADEDD